jgi:hypothetical protein
MTLTPDQRFTFDVQGYLHIRAGMASEEIAEVRTWIDEALKLDLDTLGARREGDAKFLNRPISCILDVDPRFARFLDHPAVQPVLSEVLGREYRHIDNELYFTYPGYEGGPWHRGVRAHPTGDVVDGTFRCAMVKVFYCMSDVGPGEGEFVVIPGSHKAMFEIDLDRIELPCMHRFDDVKTGDIIIFNEALLHNGRPNPSGKTRQTIIMNFGRESAGVWHGYRPLPETLAAVTPRQRAILSNRVPQWHEPGLLVEA